MVIDGHIHVGRWNYPHYSSLEVTVVSLNALLDKCEIDGAVVMPSDRKENEHLLQELKSKGKKKYWFFPWIDPSNNTWQDFLNKNINDVDGVKIHASLDQVQGGISNKIYRPLLEFINVQHLPIYVHCGRMQKTASYKYVLRVAKKFPGISFIMCHLGGDHEKLKLQAPIDVKKSKLENVFFDISATREVWTIASGIQQIGAERFIFASDYPVMHPRVAIETIKVLDLSDTEQELVFGKNFLNIMERNNKNRAR